MICPNCGALLLDNAKYCEECGSLQPDYEARIQKAETAAQVRVNTQPEAAAVPGELKSPAYVGFKDAVKLYFSNFFNYSGRSSILEYWYGAVFALLVSVGLSILGGSGLIGILQLAIELPMLSLAVRRLHDVGKSGWWVLLMLTGFGMIALLVWHLRLGTPETNKWGAPAEDTLLPA